MAMVSTVTMYCCRDLVVCQDQLVNLALMDHLYVLLIMAVLSVTYIM